MFGKLNLSVIALTYRRPKYLEIFLQSLADCNLDGVGEIILAINGQDSFGEEIAESFKSRLSSLRVIVQPRRSRGEARNLAVSQAKGNWFYFLDDDVVIPPDLFQKARQIITENPMAWGIGGPNLTPKESGLFEKSVGRILESRFGAGPMRRRHKALGKIVTADDRAFALCNLCLRREVFSDLGFHFDAHLVSAEENLLIARLEKIGRHFFYVPELSVYHFRRGTWNAVFLQAFKSGAGRRQAMMRMPSATKAVFFLPLFFRVYLFSLILMRPSWPYWLGLWAYFLFDFLEAVFWGIESKSFRAMTQFFLLAPACHLAYAFGFIFGGWV